MTIPRFTPFFSLVAIVPFLASPSDAADDAAIPFDQLDRSIIAEPEYVCDQPLYGLYVLDARHRTKVWTVLDKSSAEADSYDVVYIDIDANGKLTDAGERLTANDGNSFTIAEFTDPNTGDTHTNLKLRISKESNVMFGLDWKGKHRVAGGYAIKPGPYTRFGKTPAEAPIVKLVGEGAFAFQTWMAPDELTIDSDARDNDVKFFVGHQGLGDHTFAAMMHPFLPEDVALEATLVYTSKSGEQKKLKSVLKDRC